ncbi:hypothetical protein AYI70_g6849 [Smittium culicis]|uniref:Uncharacterized protein n=1 Tax=Smittium culicis TaxID=133412 RepID=A0A1R1XN44_9FUNG|nr:hypothetical protein AYI70_g6849 [Smittium culicis]
MADNERESVYNNDALYDKYKIENSRESRSFSVYQTDLKTVRIPSRYYNNPYSSSNRPRRAVPVNNDFYSEMYHSDDEVSNISKENLNRFSRSMSISYEERENDRFKNNNYSKKDIQTKMLQENFYGNRKDIHNREPDIQISNHDNLYSLNEKDSTPGPLMASYSSNSHYPSKIKNNLDSHINSDNNSTNSSDQSKSILKKSLKSPGRYDYQKLPNTIENDSYPDSNESSIKNVLPRLKNSIIVSRNKSEISSIIAAYGNSENSSSMKSSVRTQDLSSSHTQAFNTPSNYNDTSLSKPYLQKPGEDHDINLNNKINQRELKNTGSSSPKKVNNKKIVIPLQSLSPKSNNTHNYTQPNKPLNRDGAEVKSSPLYNGTSDPNNINLQNIRIEPNPYAKEKYFDSINQHPDFHTNKLPKDKYSSSNSSEAPNNNNLASDRHNPRMSPTNNQGSTIIPKNHQEFRTQPRDFRDPNILPRINQNIRRNPESKQNDSTQLGNVQGYQSNPKYNQDHSGPLRNQHNYRSPPVHNQSSHNSPRNNLNNVPIDIKKHENQRQIRDNQIPSYETGNDRENNFRNAPVHNVPTFNTQHHNINSDMSNKNHPFKGGRVYPNHNHNSPYSNNRYQSDKVFRSNNTSDSGSTDHLLSKPITYQHTNNGRGLQRSDDAFRGAQSPRQNIANPRNLYVKDSSYSQGLGGTNPIPSFRNEEFIKKESVVEFVPQGSYPKNKPIYTDPISFNNQSSNPVSEKKRNFMIEKKLLH